MYHILQTAPHRVFTIQSHSVVTILTVGLLLPVLYLYILVARHDNPQDLPLGLGLHSKLQTYSLELLYNCFVPESCLANKKHLQQSITQKYMELTFKNVN
jgi:hypothetical protein